MDVKNLREVFNEVMDSEGIFEFGGERRLYGFLFMYQGRGRAYITVEGRIPLPLAEKINSDPFNKMKICVEGCATHRTPLEKARHDFNKGWNLEERKKLISQGKADELYINYYHVETIEGVKHIIKCIREYGEINKWAIGNY